jgi:hypothetical protein
LIFNLDWRSIDQAQGCADIDNLIAGRAALMPSFGKKLLA